MPPKVNTAGGSGGGKPEVYRLTFSRLFSRFMANAAV